MNQRARVRGMHLHTDASRIRYYPITPTDIGLDATDEHEVGLRYSESITGTVVAVAELGRYDVRRRGFLRNGTFLAVAAIAPSRDWLLAVLDATEPRPGSRIGLAQVGVIRKTFAMFQEADTMHGGAKPLQGT